MADYSSLYNTDDSKVLSVYSRKPVKCNSSYGKWCVYYRFSIPFGTGSTSGCKYFGRKKEARNWAKQFKEVEE